MMPVGFENSALKMSFSLSSLPSGGGQGSPQQAMMQVERPYSSLTKKTRANLERDMWRRSWGTQEEKKDDFWAALQPNYNYLMDNNLIESCKEANGELSCDEEEAALLSKWSFKDFTAQFSELCSWLNDIQETVYGKEENIRDRNLRLEHVEAMQRNVYKRKLFTEQAKRLLLEHSELQDEVTWRVNYLSSKWDMLEQSISPSKVDPSQKSFCADVAHEADCLKEWIREMERRLKPLNMHVANDWNKLELVEKITECEVLHQDIRAHGKVVAAVLKRAELASASVQLARRLERRWHLLFLRALEWQFHLENLLKHHKHPHPEQMCSESDEEPLSKHPRLSGSGGDCSDQQTDDGSYFEDDIKEYWVKDARSSDVQTSSQSSSLSRKCSLYCEHCKEVGVNVSSQTTSHQHMDSNSKHVNKEEIDDGSAEKHASATALPNVPSWSSATSAENEASNFDQSYQKAPNCATFYCKHRDTNLDRHQCKGNVEGEFSSSYNKSHEMKVDEESSDEEWTYTSGKKTVIGKEKGSCLSVRSPLLPNRKRNVAVRLDFGDTVGQTLVSEETTSSVQCHESVENMECHAVAASLYNDLSLPRSTEDTKECIKWLVRQAELLVREDTLPGTAEAVDPLANRSAIASSQSRHARIKQWVKMHSALENNIQVPDSCDASGEYTTGDSDEECSADSREESSSITLVNKHLDALLNSHPRLEAAECFSNSNVPMNTKMSEEVHDPKEISKVVTRCKQHGKQERPWSVSGISQLASMPRKDEETGFANFSTSESALHQMLITPNQLIQDREGPALSCGFQGNLSSSTVIESTKAPETHGGSLQRRRSKQKKKSFQGSSFKNDPTSDSMNQIIIGGNISSTKYRNPTRTAPKVPASNVQVEDVPTAHSSEKTRTLSETTTCTSATSEHHSASDSSVFPSASSSSKILDAADVTLRPEEVSNKSSRFPLFRLGPEEGAVTPKPAVAQHAGLQSGADSDMDRAGCAQAADEQLSSSEQAWDNYQEKYMSEPYSEEIADSEVARRLLEFGDDYHNFLDSQSDCASSVEFSQRTSPQRKRRSIVGAGDSSVLDSDSDLEDIHHVIKQSQSHFIFAEQVLNKHLSKATSDVWVSDYAEIIATCKENKRCLRVIFENVKEGDILTLKERKEIGELLEKWNTLQIHADELQRVSSLQQKLVVFRKRLLDLTTKMSSLIDNLNDMTHLESVILALKEELLSLMDFKEQLLQLNVAVHELGTDSVSQDNTISSVVPHLKEDVTDLYRIWSNSFQSISSRLAQFERAVQTWEKFDKELSDLQTTLQCDHSTLLSLGKSLDDGAAAVEDVAVSIRDIARLLSEVPGTYQKNHHSSSQDVQEASLGAREGSLSDSGISDSGSENELSERARRLASLRKLAHHLQTELGSSDGLVMQVNKRIEQLDHELHELQDVCRKLIVRTTFWAEIPDPEMMSNNSCRVPEIVRSDVADSKTSGKDITVCSKSHLWGTEECAEPRNDDTNKNDSAKGKRLPWIRRVARAALPVQLALVTLLCLACFLEPHCCESVNNLSLSLSPQLRYLYGPPPV